MNRPQVGVLGATSLVGFCLLPSLEEAGYLVTAFSRGLLPRTDTVAEWRGLSPTPTIIRPNNKLKIEYWICVAPIWVLPEHFAMLEAHGVQRLVALSSTSRFTKGGSTDPEEQAIALRLTDAETRVQAWAAGLGVQWTILRPTLIYGLGKDKNIVEIARFVRRFEFFPVFAKANGLRQPLHAKDVAAACIAALSSPNSANRAYNLSGGETMSYRDMVARIFTTLGLPVRMFSVPLFVFRLFVTILRHLPRYRNWSFAMAERMNRDLVFDHSEAARDFGFKPGPFALAPEDVRIQPINPAR